jgi:diguanylate cyclase (GGDEF)-like protein
MSFSARSPVPYVRGLTDEEYQQAQRRMFARLSFDDLLEASYRQHLDRRYRLSRVIFFGICAVSFLIGPAFNHVLFDVSDDAFVQVLLIQWAWALPVLTLTALAPIYISNPTTLGAISVAGNLTLWGAALSLHWLHLTGHMSYPFHVVNFTVMAVAFFGGFRVRLIMLGGSIAIVLSLLAVLVGDHSEYPVKHFVYETFYFWMIGMGGLVTVDLLNRDSYLSRLRIRTISETDALTGLLNRGAFELLYERAVRMAGRERRQMAVALIDLDHFKQINDIHGHTKGDEVLRLAGEALLQMRGGNRPLDIRARYGGEEFVVTWYDVDADDIASMAESLLTAIRGVEVAVDAGMPPIRVTTSVGLVAGVPAGAEGGAALMQAADRLLYEAKRDGRDRAYVAAGMDSPYRVVGAGVPS